MRKRCINKNDFSDITFLIGPKREPIHAHRAMLAARSEVFRTVLKQQLVHGNNKQGRDKAKSGSGLVPTICVPECHALGCRGIGPVRASLAVQPIIFDKNETIYPKVKGPLVLEDEKPEVFLTMLDYMYTNCCTLTIDLCPDVLSNAIEYGLDGLRKIACRFMADCLSIESAAVIFQSAILHDQKELKKVVIAINIDF